MPVPTGEHLVHAEAQTLKASPHPHQRDPQPQLLPQEKATISTFFFFFTFFYTGVIFHPDGCSQASLRQHSTEAGAAGHRGGMLQ